MRKIPSQKCKTISVYIQIMYTFNKISSHFWSRFFFFHFYCHYELFLKWLLNNIEDSTIFVRLHVVFLLLCADTISCYAHWLCYFSIVVTYNEIESFLFVLQKKHSEPPHSVIDAELSRFSLRISRLFWEKWEKNANRFISSIVTLKLCYVSCCRGLLMNDAPIIPFTLYTCNQHSLFFCVFDLEPNGYEDSSARRNGIDISKHSLPQRFYKEKCSQLSYSSTSHPSHWQYFSTFSFNQFFERW